MKYLPVLLILATLPGCAEGGTGGTGGITPAAPQTAFVTVTGRADKGPYAAGSEVRAADATGGVVGPPRVVGTAADLGAFAVAVEASDLTLLSVAGAFFSETRGEQVATGLTLESLVVRGATEANINLLTHITAPRALQLVRDGMDPTTALQMATAEVRLALQPVVPPPASATNFAALGVLNALSTADPEGNGYLLALSAIVELAVADRVAQGESDTAAWTTVLSTLRNDLADDGVLAARTLGPLLDSRTEVNADQVVNHLLALDGTLAADLIEDEAFRVGTCGVRAGALRCEPDADNDGGLPTDAGSEAGESSAEVGFDPVVANLNLFLDTDDDGLVNADDDDDDGDGIADADDPLPYQS